MKIKDEGHRTLLIKNISSTIAHDLKGPMSVIKTYTYNIKHKINDQKDVLILISKIENQVNKGLLFIENSLSSIKNEYDLNVNDLNINYVINTAVRLFNEDLDANDINIVINISDDFYVNADSILLIRAIVNILNNARDAMLNVNNKNIYINSAKVEGLFAISIKDTGIGIKEEDINNIYDPLFSNKKTGTGIGLSYCKTALNLMGIKIKCHSVYGQFTEFFIIFPAGFYKNNKKVIKNL